MKFVVSVDGSYRTVTSYPLELGQYYHLVGTYDGQSLRIFVNGAPINEIAAPGKITWPADETAQYLAIGGDAGLNNTPESTIRGELVLANVYSQVLTPEEILDRKRRRGELPEAEQEAEIEGGEPTVEVED
jgi:hypothetical protein